jgi:hypothetical protein
MILHPMMRCHFLLNQRQPVLLFVAHLANIVNVPNVWGGWYRNLMCVVNILRDMDAIQVVHQGLLHPIW